MREPSPEVDAIARRVIGAAIEVHRALGPGFLEVLYELALCREFELQGINFERQVAIDVRYKGVVVGQNRLDLLVEGLVIVEFKAVEQLTDIHTAQLLSYVRAASLELGHLINFNVAALRAGVKRVINTGRGRESTSPLRGTLARSWRLGGFSTTRPRPAGG